MGFLDCCAVDGRAMLCLDQIRGFVFSCVDDDVVCEYHVMRWARKREDECLADLMLAFWQARQDRIGGT